MGLVDVDEDDGEDLDVELAATPNRDVPMVASSRASLSSESRRSFARTTLD